MARTGRIPLGYFDDEAATRKTFPEVDGQRVVISGDRGSLACRRHAAVVRTRFAGGQHRWGEGLRRRGRRGTARAPGRRRCLGGGSAQRALGPGTRRAGRAARRRQTSGSEPLHAHCTSQLARFKAPKEFIFVDQVRRLGNGKADYRWAKSTAVQAGVADMTRTKAIDCLVNVHFGETEKQPTWMLKVRDDYFKGPKSMFAPGRPVRTARRDGRAGRAEGDPDGQPRQAVGHRAQVRRGTSRPVRAGDGWSQPAASRCRRCGSSAPSSPICRWHMPLWGPASGVTASTRRATPSTTRCTPSARRWNCRCASTRVFPGRRFPVRCRTRSISTGCVCASPS